MSPSAAELRCDGVRRDTPVAIIGPPSAAIPALVPMPLPARSVAPEIRIELRRGATSVTVNWPADLAGECAARLRELLQ